MAARESLSSSHPELTPGTSVQLKIPQKPSYHLQEGTIVRKAKKKYYDVALVLNNVMVRVHEARLIVLSENNEDLMPFFKELYEKHQRVGSALRKEFKSKFQVTEEKIKELHTEYKRELYFPSKDLQTNEEGPNYEVIDVLGDGLHSTVVKARALAQSKLPEKTEVALKHVKREIFASKKASKRVNEIYVKRIFRELKIMHYALNSKYITRMLDIWAPHDDYKNCTTLYSCTELCYCDLQDLIYAKKRVRNLDYDLICKWSFQMLEALSCLHYADIVHRDIKPANILIDLDMNIKLTDFNLARWVETDVSKPDYGIDPKNFFTTAVVAANYRPFEVQWRMLMDRQSQLSHQVPQDEAHLIDVWSVALVIYELLGLWHEHKGPLNFFNTRHSEPVHFCVLIVNQTGWPTPKYLRKLPKALRTHLEKNCDPDRELIERNMYQRFPKCPQDETSIIHLLLQMIKTDPAERLVVEQCIEHPCLQAFEGERTSRVEKAIELLRYCTEMGGHSTPTKNFFIRKGQGDVFDIAKAELQKEPHWFRPLYKGVRDELMEGYKKARKLGRVGTTAFAESRGLSNRQLKQLAAYVDSLENNITQNLKFDHDQKFFGSYKERRKANHAPKWFAALDADEKDQIEVVLEDILDLNTAVTQLKNEFNITQSTKEVASLIAYLESPARKRAKEIDHLQIGPANLGGDEAPAPLPLVIPEDDPIEERATEGSNILDDLDGKTDAQMVAFLKEHIDGLTSREDPENPEGHGFSKKDLDEMISKFAETFNMEDESEAEGLVHVLWLRQIIQDEGEELEQIQARLMTDLLYGEQEGTAFLHHVLDMSPDYVDEESALTFNPKVLASTVGDDWIFAFETQGHIDGERIRELIEEEINVFRSRVFTFEENKQNKVYRFSRSESRIKKGVEHLDHITVLDDSDFSEFTESVHTETPRNMTEMSFEEEISNEIPEECPKWVESIDAKGRTLLTKILKNQEYSETLVKEIGDEFGIDQPDVRQFLKWFFAHGKHFVKRSPENPLPEEPSEEGKKKKCIIC